MADTIGIPQTTDPNALTFEEGKNLNIQAGKVFQPRAPVTTRELFAGRWSQLTTVTDAVGQTGLHVIIYGERGVGKSSLSIFLFHKTRCFW